MPAFQIISGFTTNPGATITALTVTPGDAFSVRSFDAPATCELLELWSSNATGGIFRLTSPRLHDNNQGIRLQVPAALQYPLLPRQIKQPLYSVDLLAPALSGGGAEVDAASMLVYYSNIAGINQNLTTWAAIQDKIVNLCGVEVDLVSGATAGNYGGGRTLNQDFQNLKADVNYAVLGYTCASAFCTLAFNGPDTGNLNVGGPGTTNTDVTGDWFVRLGQWDNLPSIPVIKANNQGATTVQLMSVDTATSHHVSLILAQLNT